MLLRTASDRFALVVRRQGGLAPVATVLGVSLGYVSLLAAGRRAPGRALACRIERLWGIRARDWPSL
jgi:hypothetical protein